jgi:hypothetical protein
MELNTTNDTSSVEAVTRSAGSSVLTDRDPGAHAPGRGPQPSSSAGVEVFMLSCATRTVLLKNRKIASLTPIMSLLDVNDDCHVRLDSQVVLRFYLHGIL